MSQTATYEIELLDAHPHLEHGPSFDGVKNPHSQAPDAFAETEQYFSGGSLNSSVNASTSVHATINNTAQAEGSGFRIGKVYIEDKVFYLAGSCMGVFAVGLNDTATGANLPSIQDHYHLPYEVVSLVFLAGFGGYLISCMINSVLQNAIGTRNVLVMAGILYGGGSLLISFAPPFPVVMVGLCLMGFGGGFYEACLTSVISHFENIRFMNILYAFFGLGALVSPFVVGALAKAGIAWRLYYWFPFSLAALVTICHFVLFKRYVMPSDHEETSEHKSVRAKFKQVMHIPTTWVGIILIILSFAIADTLSNWLTSYLIDVKGSGPDVSRYQLSMFWAGLTAGRIFFSLPFIHVRERIGNTLLLVATGGAIGLLWAVNSTVSNWIGIAVAGFFLGPNTPGILSIISTRVPPSLKGIVVSITIGLGLVGATLGPLLFGITIGKVKPGLHILPPVIMVLASLSALFFWAIPPRRKVDVSKASSKKGQTYDGETDEEEVDRRKQNKAALAKKQSSGDMSKLFVKNIDGMEESIKFYIVDWEDWDTINDIRDQIAKCGGEVVDERPREGYSLIDPRTEEGELELATRSTRTRCVVSFLFVEESIKRGSLMSPLESLLFVKEDKPVKFHLHESLSEDEIENLRYDILLRGGNPDVDISETQAVIHHKDFRRSAARDKRWRQIELFETSDWLKSSIARKRFTLTGAGGRLTAPPAARPKPLVQPGRKPGAPRTEFTEEDDERLILWMAYQFGRNQAGRQGNRPYQVLVQQAEHLWWTHRHTWHSWRERYKIKRTHFDPLIIQAVDERETKKKPKKHRVPEFPDSSIKDSDDESEDGEYVGGEERPNEANGDEEEAQEARPSKARAKPKPVKRRASDSSEVEDDPEPPKQIKQSASQPTRPTPRGVKRAKTGSRPEAPPFIKTSASQKAREAPPLKSPTQPPSELSSPVRASPPPRAEPIREESPDTEPELDQEQGDSSSTQLGNGIIDQAVLGGAQGAVDRHNAELAEMSVDEEQDEIEESPYEDPDVDVVGITQVDTPPVDMSMSQSEGDETGTESTDKSIQVNEAEETNETLLDTVEDQLLALANTYGAIYARVEAYYTRAVEDGKNQDAAIEFAGEQLRIDMRRDKGKGRAS
ncbi:unnamed protein product [Rhizoctonia solani]|uniref:Major facilitator superfamily (MFS) profile domain-containing protein n=1 Tax=Rhizoctonia solani TaxID=456999 RepID=A0A8H3G9Q3_9AGAM|nr:unnamed protein product [Rhizoctonia solani]